MTVAEGPWWSCPEAWPAAEPCQPYRAGRPADQSLRHASDRELLELLAGRFRRRDATGEPWPEAVIEVAGCDETELAHLLELSPRGGRTLAAVLELHRRLSEAKRPRRPALDTPEAVNRFMRPLALLDHERFMCLPLDARSRLIGPPRVVSIGDVDGTDAGPRAFFRAALRVGAVTAVAVHNHPAGDPTPSPADQTVTRRLVHAGRLVDMRLVDHVVIGASDAFFSFRRDRKELFG